jgi:hypothetical protein
LYGLRKAPKLWFDAINGFVLSLGFVQSEADPNLYTKGDIHLLLYVDDILLFYPQTDAGKCEAKLITNALMAQFKTKVLGAARQFLGLEISRDSYTISLGQEKYVNDIIARFGMQDAFDVPTPLEPDVKLDAASESIVRSLIALSTLEAEYIACSNAAREAKWLRQLSLDVKNNTKTVPATIIFTDNQCSSRSSLESGLQDCQDGLPWSSLVQHLGWTT